MGASRPGTVARLKTRLQQAEVTYRMWTLYTMRATAMLPAIGCFWWC